MTSVAQILLVLLDILYFLVIAQIIMSWLINFQVLNLRQPIVAQLWYGVNQLLEPIYRPIRKFMPQTGGMDFSPIVVFVGIIVARIVIRNNLM